MFNGGPFSVNSYEQDEARRIEVQNRALEERTRVHEEQRRNR